MPTRLPPGRLNAELLEDRTAPALLPPTPPTLRDTAFGFQVKADATSDWNVRFYTTAATFREFTAFSVSKNVANNPIDVNLAVAVADVTGDGVPDVVASLFKRSTNGTSPIAEPVRVFDGTSILALPANPGAGSAGRLPPAREWHPFGAATTHGTLVAAADFDGDGRADVVTSRTGGDSSVRIYAGADMADRTSDPAPKAAFNGIDDPEFTGGVHAAVGHLNADGIPDLLVGAGWSGDPRVAGFDGASIRANWGTAAAPGRLFNDFYAFPPGSGYRPGIHVAVADLDADGYGEVLAGPRRGPQPELVAFDGKDLVTSFGGTLTKLWRQPAGDTANLNSNGLRIAAKDLDKDGKTDLVLAHAGRSNVVTTIRGKDIPPNGVVSVAGRINPTPHPDSANRFWNEGVWVG